MIVNIAGFNVDKSLLDKNDIRVTPETISAAYARISRSTKSVTELRKQSLKEIAKARQSNEKIVFDMGHSSIAEHAVFNLDIIGVSRFLTEFIQKSRLASFTEKSQRYVTFDNNVVIPGELLREGSTAALALHKEYRELVSELYALYRELSLAIDLKEGLTERAAPSEKAKEDARYLLPLATETQMGVTINARSLEALLRRLAKLDLAEARLLYELLYKEAKNIAPSLIRYTEADEYHRNSSGRSLPEMPDSLDTRFLQSAFPLSNDNPLATKVYLGSDKGEDVIVAALIFEHYPQDFPNLLKKVAELPPEEKSKMISSLFNGMKFYHKAPACFELVDCIVQMSLSACCFAQLKRHRIATIIRSDYRPAYGYVAPPSFSGTGLEEKVADVMEKVADVYEKLENHHRGIGNYILTNAHRRNILFKTNLRELYHFSRLRSDEHAQWEIRTLSGEIDRQLRKLLPDACCKIMGKSEL